MCLQKIIVFKRLIFKKKINYFTRQKTLVTNIRITFSSKYYVYFFITPG